MKEELDVPFVENSQCKDLTVDSLSELLQIFGCKAISGPVGVLHILHVSTGTVVKAAKSLFTEYTNKTKIQRAKKWYQKVNNLPSSKNGSKFNLISDAAINHTEQSKSFYRLMILSSRKKSW